MIARLEVRSFDQHPPIKTTPEEAILRPVRVERCACGDLVYQYEGDHPTTVVGRHNATLAHRAWRGTGE